HILGSATVETVLDHDRPVRLVYSGDLGRWGRPILRDPELTPEGDVVLVESTYGNRLHDADPEGALARIVVDASQRGGVLLVPAFAVGRTQELIWILQQLEAEGRIPALPVFIDSPMAVQVTAIYCRHAEQPDGELHFVVERSGCPFCSGRYTLIRS